MEVFMAERTEHRYGHSVYSLTYHIILVTKYRRPVLTGAVAEELRSECTRLIKSMGGHVAGIETDRDHVHILAELSRREHCRIR